MRAAFSLLEMLVVLAILSALTMVAVQSLGPVEQQARYETTKRTLEAVKGAVISVNQTGGASLVSGLTADTSLLPDLTSLATFYDSLITGSGMPAGWRGPYVQPNHSSLLLVDGWQHTLTAYVQDKYGAPKPSGFDQLTDCLVISNTGPTTTSDQFVSTTISGNMLSASLLTVNLYGVDLTGNRIPLAPGDSSPLSSLPTISITNGVVTTSPGIPSAVGTVCSWQVAPLTTTHAGFLVGSCVVKVTTTLSNTTNYEAYSPIQQINLLPGTSPIVELLVVRQTSVVTSSSGGM
jgi:prepilin-type N-terminal cleavage/methylation domain-containing protein